MPGPIGPPGYNGSEGPASRSGSSDFSQCQFEIKSASMIPGSNKIIVYIDEPSVSTSIPYILKIRIGKSTDKKGFLNVTCLYPFDISYNLRLRPQSLGDLNLIFLNQAQSGGS